MTKNEMNQTKEIKEWNDVLTDEFKVDNIFYALFSQLSVIKNKKINSKFFIEMSIYYNSNNELMANIDLNECSFRQNSEMCVGHTVKELYSKCISKDEQYSSEKVIDASKKGEWLSEFDRLYDEVSDKIKTNTFDGVDANE